MKNVLHEIVPDHTRRAAYVVYATAGLVLGATQVGYSAANAGQPTWLTVALAVFAFIGTAVGFTASSNTPDQAFVDVPEAKHVDTDGFPEE